jgi:hypothetical protein
VQQIVQWSGQQTAIGTGQDGIAISESLAGNSEFRHDPRLADTSRIGLANRRLQPLGLLTMMRT